MISFFAQGRADDVTEPYILLDWLALVRRCNVAPRHQIEWHVTPQQATISPSMKLLGIEFFDFACFDRQFVRLSPGLVLLVGKNNAGKTAILRGLTLLAGLPIDNPRQVASNVAPYCRRQTPQPTLEFHLIFAAESADFSHFSNADQGWINLMLAKNPFFRFIFRAWPNQNLVTWSAINLQIGDYPHDPPIPVVIFAPAGAVLNHYQMTIEEGLPRLKGYPRTSLLPHLGSVTAQPDGTHSVILKHDAPLMGTVGELRTTKLVAAHRVPHSSMGLQSTNELPSDANTLAGYLQTLQNNERSKFERIELFLTSVFPEFKYVNPSNRNNQVAITLTSRATSQDVPLSHCGTGVEQLLSLATFAMTTAEESILLMDEPHSFLHPSAERSLVEFINNNMKRFFVVSTHSAILINSTEADRINYLQPPGQGFSFSSANVQETSRILLELGYRNSDVLFNDRLIAVEGESDREILRVLLPNLPGISNENIDRTGFPVMEGAGEGCRALQTAVLRFEKLLDAIGRAKQPRLYLFDGDKTSEDQELIRGTRFGTATVPIAFLPRLEIENYLLDAEAIAKALEEQAELDEIELAGCDTASVNHELDTLLQLNDSKLFPKGKLGDPRHSCKGSLVLERIFNKFGRQRYEKKRTGLLLARLLKHSLHPELNEIATVVQGLF
ncbi:MAG TPA: AAA family ATPase [Candidatus Angelobacter sp.]|jgi:ABC-type transport system involved in cytochrome c biogenesis ATPase subunit